MPNTLYHIIIVFLTRTIAKGFLFIALSVGTPTINAMRSLEDRTAIVIVLEQNLRSRSRGIIRVFGYEPGYKFIMYV